MPILRPLIGVINLSKKISDDDVKTMVMACQDQLNHDVAPHWHMESWFVIFYSDPKQISPRALPMVIFDAPDAPNALGYHSEMNGKPYGRVFVDPVLQNGGAILYDPANPQNVSVSSVLSHEIIELYIDRDANQWADGPQIREGSSYAYEACDPVQGNSYSKTINGKKVSLSNFILRSWFDPQNPVGNPVDFMHTCPGAFQLAPGGYMIVRSAPRTEQQVFGAIKMATWQHAVKKYPMGRTSRRVANVVKKPWWKYLI
jgi:hypothetical protein